MRHARSGIPLEHVRLYLDDCKFVAQYIVSVGCGNGVYEYEATKHDLELRKKLILVDPAPESYELWPTTGVGFLKPDYATVADLIKQKPHVVGNCVLLMIWLDIADRFDYPSFETLKPLSVICMNEHVNGDFMSPSAIFKRNYLLYLSDSVRYRYIENVEPPSVEKAINLCKEHSGDFMGCAGSIIMNIVLTSPELFGYKLIAQTRYGVMSTYGPIYPRLTWIAKKSSKIPKNKKSCDSSLQQLAIIKLSSVDINGIKPDTGFDNFSASVNLISNPAIAEEFKAKEARLTVLKQRNY